MQITNAKVSVIIPCYNAEKYLRQCINSVVNQTLKELEIICVNDGSTDSTLSILREYALRDARVTIIDKPNGGYGESMNRGFDMATGEYLGIVESDDYAEPEMFEKLYLTAKRYDLDVVKSGFFFYYSTPTETNTPRPIASHITSGRTFCPVTDFPAKSEMVEFFNLKPTIWSSIYKTSFIRANNIRFNETPGASYQDASFNFKVWACAKKVRLLEECFLHYRQDNEASSVNSPGKVYCVCDEYDEIERFLEQHQMIKGLLLPVMVRLKYDTYMWNYNRLSETLQAEFIHRFRDDFLRHRSDGIILPGYFEEKKIKDIDKIIFDPDRYHTFKVMNKNEIPVPGFYDTPQDIRRKERLAKSSRLFRLVLKGLYCFQDHGFKYTLKRILKKIGKRVLA